MQCCTPLHTYTEHASVKSPFANLRGHTSNKCADRRFVQYVTCRLCTCVFLPGKLRLAPHASPAGTLGSLSILSVLLLLVVHLCTGLQKMCRLCCWSDCNCKQWWPIKSLPCGGMLFALLLLVLLMRREAYIPEDACLFYSSYCIGAVA